MGRYLALLPFDFDWVKTDFSHSILECTQRSELFEELEKLPSMPVPEQFHTYLGYDPETERTCYGNTQTTNDGEQLMYVLVEQLLPFSTHELVRDNFLNRAVWAYLKELPRKTKIALYFH
ncbi:MAG: hypothetical protein HZC02_01565 [Candidatus Levybacteria bacterium]|nr:hypothetical protein [Candidatus Levybacteria bacterium]